MKGACGLGMSREGSRDPWCNTDIFKELRVQGASISSGKNVEFPVNLTDAGRLALKNNFLKPGEVLSLVGSMEFDRVPDPDSSPLSEEMSTSERGRIFCVKFEFNTFAVFWLC
jgi:hypothetical protein